MREDQEKINPQRSAAYPSMNLSEALSRLTKLKDNLGINGSYTRSTVASGIGYKALSGTAARAVAALVHYGLLSRSKDRYTISDKARAYLFPSTDKDQQVAIREAALSPNLFLILYEQNKGQVLPRLIDNHLVNQFHIQPKVASGVASIFRESMRTAGLLNDLDILSADYTQLHDSPHQQENEPPSQANSIPQQPVFNLPGATPDYQDFTLNSGIIVSFPRSMSLRIAMGEFVEELRMLDKKAFVTNGNDDSVEDKEETM